jgi:hypothetical protein
MLQAMAVAAKRDALLNLCFYPAPGVTVIDHAGDIVILISNMVKL